MTGAQVCLSALLGNTGICVYTWLFVSSCLRGHRGDSREATWPQATGRGHPGERRAETGHCGDCGALDRHRPESDSPAPWRGTRTRAGPSTVPVSRCVPPSCRHGCFTQQTGSSAAGRSWRSKSKRDMVQTDHLSGLSPADGNPAATKCLHVWALDSARAPAQATGSQDRVPVTPAVRGQMHPCASGQERGAVSEAEPSYRTQRPADPALDCPPEGWSGCPSA